MPVRLDKGDYEGARIMRFWQLLGRSKGSKAKYSAYHAMPLLRLVPSVLGNGSLSFRFGCWGKADEGRCPDCCKWRLQSVAGTGSPGWAPWPFGSWPWAYQSGKKHWLFIYQLSKSGHLQWYLNPIGDWGGKQEWPQGGPHGDGIWCHLGEEDFLRIPLEVYKYVDDNVLLVKLNFDTVQTDGHFVRDNWERRTHNVFCSILYQAMAQGMKTKALLISELKSYAPRAHFFDDHSNLVRDGDSMEILGVHFSLDPGMGA